MKGQEHPEHFRQQEWPLSPRVTGRRVLTTVLLVAVVGAVVVVVAPPQGRDAPSILALKLSGFTLRQRVSPWSIRKRGEASRNINNAGCIME